MPMFSERFSTISSVPRSGPQYYCFARRSRHPLSAPKLSGLLPTNQTVRVFHKYHFVLFQHRHQKTSKLPFPQFAFIKLSLHWLARVHVRKSTHEKENVGIFDGRKWPQEFHPKPRVKRHRFLTKYLQESFAATGLGGVSPHFDYHRQTSISCAQGAG